MLSIHDANVGQQPWFESRWHESHGRDQSIIRVCRHYSRFHGVSWLSQPPVVSTIPSSLAMIDGSAEEGQGKEEGGGRQDVEEEDEEKFMTEESG